MFLAGKWAPRRKFAAQEAFFTLPKSTILRHTSDLCVPVDKGGSLVSILIEVIKGLLQCSEAVALGDCHKRLLAMHDATELSKVLAQVVSAIQTFEWHDQEAVQNEIGKSKRFVAEKPDFQLEFAQRRGAAGPSGSSGRQPRQSKYPDLPSTIPQATVKRFVPPGASIWRGVASNLWCGRLPPLQTLFHARGQPWMRARCT